MGCHPGHIFFKYKPDGMSFDYHICFANDIPMTHQGHFGHFNMSTLRIKFFYGGAERGYGGGRRIFQVKLNLKSIFIYGIILTRLLGDRDAI